MSEQGYNGWSNYETWAVKLWIDNDQGSAMYARNLVEDARVEASGGHHVWTVEQHARFTLADSVRDWVCVEMRPEADASMFEDLLSAALDRVDWQEIADNLLSEID